MLEHVSNAGTDVQGVAPRLRRRIERASARVGGLVLITAVMAVLSANGVSARPREAERGVPYLTNYEPKTDNRAIGYQSWAAIEDPRGVMYFGNTSGVVEYGGVEWRLLTLPSRSTVRSLAVDDHGTVYVGGQGTFGYLAANPRGQLTYVPLEQRVPESDRHFADVWKVHARPDGVYFQTFSHLFHWDGETVHSIVAKPPFHFSFLVGDELYLKQDGIGLVRLEDHDLTPVAGGERFADDRVYTLLPLADGSLLVGTRDHGLWRLRSDGTSVPFRCEADEYLRSNQLYHGAVLNNGWIALATLRGGTILIDDDGSIQEILDRRIGLQDSTITSVFVDRRGGLWMTMERNVSRVETPAALSTFTERNGLIGAVQSVLRHGNSLYVATTQGVYLLVPGSQSALEVVPHFQPIPGIATQCWKLVSVGETVLAATNDGVFAIAGLDATLVSHDKALTLLPSRIYPDTVYIGLFDGLATLERQPAGGWIAGERIAAVADQVRTLAEHDNGALWLGVLYQGLLRVALTADGSWEVDTLEETKDALPRGYGRARVLRAANELLVGTDIGLYRIDDANRSLIPEPTADEGVLDGKPWHERLTDDDVWLVSDAGGGVGAVLRQPDGSFHWEYGPFDLLPESTIWEVLPESDGTVWFGTSDGLIRLAPGGPALASPPPAPLIRSVTAPGPTVVFRGVHVGPNGRSVAHQYLIPSLRPDANDLRFEFATPCFGAESSIQHQTYLEGYDPDWSEWSSDHVRTYTNLPPDRYTFKVRASQHGAGTSKPAEFHFAILPPWHQTWWALTLFAALGLTATVGTARAYASWARRNAHTHAEHRRRASELWHARQIQRNLLPSAPPNLQHLDIAAVHLTATEVGGDYYDFFPQDDGTLFVAIGDATGHGLGAGLMVSATKTALLTVSSNSLEDIARQLNRVLRQVHLGKRLNMALTMLALRRSPNDDSVQLSASGGGMAPMYILRTDGSVDERIVAGVPLGALDIADYTTLTDRLAANETLVLMSDGVPERLNCEGEVLDYDGVHNILQQVAAAAAASSNPMTAATMLEAILDACHRWAGSHDVNDDLTLVVMTVRPTKPSQ